MDMESHMNDGDMGRLNSDKTSNHDPSSSRMGPNRTGHRGELRLGASCELEKGA